MRSPAASDPAGSSESPASPAKQRRPLRVLLVDDHLLVRCRTRHQLEEISCVQVVAEATDGLEAVAFVRTLVPDLVFMDISMPELDGVEATRRITAEFPHIRVIMLSSYDSPSFQNNAKAAGAHGYLVKGESTESIAEAIDRVFKAS